MEPKKKQERAIVHLEKDGHHYYYGNLKALTDHWPKDAIGVIYSYLKNLYISEDKPFKNDKSINRREFSLLLLALFFKIISNFVKIAKMKKNFLYLALLTVIVSCGPKGNKPEITDNIFAPEQSELYSGCSELKGVGDFIIEQTTYTQALRSKIYSGSYIFDNFYNGYWGIARGEGYVPNGHDKSDWIEKHTPIIKQIGTPIGGVKIGQIQLTEFDLAFYNNKLAAIYFKDEKGLLHEHYIKKYGDGRGSYYSYHLDNEPCKNRDKLFSTTTIKENRVWENDKVELTYSYDYHFEMGPKVNDKKMIDSFVDDSWYLLASKSLYPKFLEELNKQKVAYDTHKQGEDTESLNQF